MDIRIADDAARAFRDAIKTRTDVRWSVTVGRGDDCQTITITAPPSRRDANGMLDSGDRKALAALFALSYVPERGIRVGVHHRDEYLRRAQGWEPHPPRAALDRTPHLLAAWEQLVGLTIEAHFSPGDEVDILAAGRLDAALCLWCTLTGEDQPLVWVRLLRDAEETARA